MTREEYEIKRNESEHSDSNSEQEEIRKRKLMKSVSIEKDREKDLSSVHSDNGFNRLKKLMSNSKNESYKVVKTKY